MMLFPIPLPIRRGFALALILAAAGSGLNAQTPGAKNVVINQIQPDQSDGQGLSVELYNYGPAQAMGGYHLEFQLDSGPSTTASGYLFPAGFTLGRHAFAVVHWAAGTDGAVHLYRGAFGSPALTPDGELRLCSSTCGAANGVDYVLWGAPSPTNRPGNLAWTGSVAFGSGAAAGYLQRSRDLNTRDAGSWTVNRQPADAALNPGQIGTRRHSRVMINEVFVPGAQVELYNPNPFPVSLFGAQISIYSANILCQTYAVSVTLLPGDTPYFVLNGGCFSGPGEIVLTDSAGEGLDYLSYGNPSVRHLPPDLFWSGTDPAPFPVIARIGDLDSNNGGEWAVTANTSLRTIGALNPSQQGAHSYDAMGAEQYNFNYMVPGRGNQISVTKPFYLREWKVRATPAAGASGVWLAVYQQSGPNWSRIYQTSLGVQSADGAYTTGRANLPIYPGVYRFMIFNDAPFNIRSSDPAENFAYGTYQGVANAGAVDYPPPASTPMGAYNAAGAAISQYFLTDPGPQIVTTSPLPPCSTGVSCSRQIAASGGAGTLAWSLTAGALPPGLNFNTATGLISGYTTASGGYSFTIQVTDANGMTDSRAFSLTVNYLYDPLAITTASPLPGGALDAGYSQPLVATGGDGNYTWYLVSGALPQGIELTPGGVVSGMPLAAGTFNFTAQARDGQGVTAAKSFALTVANPLRIVNGSLPAGYLGVSYPSTSLVGAGGTAPYTFALDAPPPLPAGLTLSGGVISGKPTVAGTTNAVFRITDSAGVPATTAKLLPITVSDAPPIAQWESRALFGGEIDKLVASPNFTTDNTAFASGRVFEVYRTGDGGVSWVRRPVIASKLANTTNQLVISPAFDANGSGAAASTLFAFNASLGVYRSTDRGDTFTAANAGLPNVGDGNLSGLAISPNFATDSRLWVCYTNNAVSPVRVDIYTTYDAGAGWAYQSSMSSASFAYRAGRLYVSPTFASDNTMFSLVAFGVGGNLFLRSTDGGASWSSLTGPGATSCGTSASTFRNVILSPRYAIDKTLFVEDSCTVISRSLDGGASFATIAQKGAALAGLARPGVQPLWYLKNANGIYGLSVSDNQGDSFTALYAGGLRSSGACYVCPQNPVNVIAPVRRADGRAYLLAATDKGVDGSYDDGQTFNPRERGIAALRVASGFTPGVKSSGGKLAALNGDHWLYSEDGGAHWIRRPPPWGPDVNGVLAAVNVVAVSPQAPGNTIFIAGDQKLYRSTDKGFTFAQIPSVTQYAEDIAFSSNGATVFLAAQQGLYKSTDSGASFTLLSSLSNNNTCTPGGDDEVRSVSLSPNYLSDGTIFVGTLEVCRSVDGGANWVPFSGSPRPPARGRVTPSATYYNLAGSNANYAWTLYSSDYASVMRSLDRGATWAAISLPSASFYWQTFVSPTQSSDHQVFVYATGPNATLYRSADDGASYAPLGGADALYTRPVTGVAFVNTSTAIAATDGGGLWKSADGGATFSPLAEYQFLDAMVNAMAMRPITSSFSQWAAAKNAAAAPTTRAASAPGEGDILAGTTLGVFRSTDQGQSFDVYSDGLGAATLVTSLRFTDATPANPLLISRDPAQPAATAKLYRLTGTTWTPLNGLGAGKWNELDQAGSSLYATRLDGIAQSSGDGGVTWGPADSPGDIAAVGYNASTGPTLANPAPGRKGPPSGAAAAVNTDAYWSVSATSGARSSPSGANGSWVARPGGNEYALPVLDGTSQAWTKIQPLGVNAASGSREVLAGASAGLFRSLDGGVTWRRVDVAGSGIETSSRAFSASLTATTAYGATDVLLGATGSVSGGVWLSSDGGEHWLKLNDGFDPNNLSISSLIRTSCTGCPVQYYSGTYGSGVYTRTIAVNPAPAITGWCFGATTCTCGTAAMGGPEEGGVPFKLCGSGFLAGVTVEFDKVPAIGCAASGSGVITCTGTPPHVAGAVALRARNPDTRAATAAQSYLYAASATPRVVNTLRVAKSASDAALTWSCGGCTAGNPARVYRAQNALFTVFPENYAGGTGGAWSDAGAVATAYSYFWSVE